MTQIKTCLKCLLVPVFFAVYILSYGQNSYRHYSVSDGLPHDITYNITQDSNGIVWVCTDDGLSKFNGETFLNYNSKNGLTSNFVTDITQISENKYAISTWGEGLHYLENDTIFKPNKFNDNDRKMYSIIKKDTLLFSTSSFQIFKYNTKENKSEQKKITLKGTLVNSSDSDNSNGALASFSKCDGTIFFHDAVINDRNLKGVYELLPSFKSRARFKYLQNQFVNSLTKRTDSTFIIGLNNRLIYGTEYEILKEHKITEIDNENIIEKILVAPNNLDELILIVSNPQGLKRLYKYNFKTKVLEDLIIQLSINTTISDVIFDFEGNLWITTFGNGVYCYYYSKPKIKNILLGNYIVDMLKMDNKIYALSASDIFSFDAQGSIVNTHKIDGFGKQLMTYNGTLYIVALNSKVEKVENFKIMSGRFSHYTELGKIFQDDSAGFISLNDNPIYRKTDLELNSVNYLNEIELFTNKGKWNYNIENLNFYKDSIFNSSLASASINHAYFKNDTYFLSSSQGFFIKGNDGLKTITEKNGLLSNTINYSTQIDDNLYLGSQKGLSIIKGDHIYNYTKSSGVSSLSIHKIIEAEDNLLIAGDNGVSILKLNDLQPEHPPRIDVVNRGNVLEYKLISFEERDDLKLMYTVDNSDWVELKALDGNIDFNNFKPNIYKLQLKARKNNSDWTFSDVLTINIKAAWYNKWWNISLLAVLLIGILSIAFLTILKRSQRRNKRLESAINQRIKAEKQLNKVRDNIAKDFHDDLGNKLASISLLSEKLERVSTNKNIDLVRKINEDSKYLYKGTKDFIFSLKEQSDYLEEIVVYLSDFCQGYCSQFGIEVEINDDTKRDIKLPFYWSKQIIFIFKEAITNTVKHANANKVILDFRYVGNKLNISFEDNGKGFANKIEARQSTNGIANMNKRAASIDCKLIIESEREKNGSKITFIGEPPI